MASSSPPPEQGPQPGPDPEDTPGLEPGGGVPPGETPPAEGGLSGLSHQEKGPNRPATYLTLVLLAILTAAIAGFIAGHTLGLF